MILRDFNFIGLVLFLMFFIGTDAISANEDCGISENLKSVDGNNSDLMAEPQSESSNFGNSTGKQCSNSFFVTPAAGLAVFINSTSSNAPAINENFGYDLMSRNSGDVPLDFMEIIENVPAAFAVSSVTTGSYINLTNFISSEGVRVSYEKNTSVGVFTFWGSSPNVGTNTTLNAPPPGLGVGEYITRIRWQYGQAAAGMTPTVRPRVSGRIINPGNNGSPVNNGDSIQTCASLNAVYTAGSAIVNRTACRSFAVGINPQAQTLVVDTTSDDETLANCTTAANDCSLRGAVSAAFTGDTIVFASPLFDTAQTVDINGQIVIDKSLKITGRGANLTTVRNVAANSRVLLINSGVTASLSGMTFTGGSINDSGGGIFNSGTLTLNNSTVSNNSASNKGGGIFNWGTLTMTNSTVNNNSASNDSGGGIENSGTLGVISSTISNNSATSGSFNVGYGGGIHNAFGTVSLINSTIAYNNANNGSGGGVFNQGSTQFKLTSKNTIIAHNITIGSARDYSGNLISLGNNLIGVTTGISGNFPAVGDLQNDNTGLSTQLAANGGTTATHSIAADSPAVNAGSNQFGEIQNLTFFANSTGTFTLTFNGQTTAPLAQNASAAAVESALNNLSSINAVGGSVRVFRAASGSPVGFAIEFGGSLGNSDQPQITGTASGGIASFNLGTALDGGYAPLTDQRGRARVGQFDIGAYEFQPLANLVVTNTNDNGTGSLRAAIASTNTTAENESISFNIPPTDAGCTNGVCTITLTSGELSINSETTTGTLAIEHPTNSPQRIAVSGNNQSRVFNLLDGANLTVRNLTVTGGRVAIGNIRRGGGIFISPNALLFLFNTSITGNNINDENPRGGGIYISPNSTANITNSTISNNHVSGNTSLNLGAGIYIDGGTATITNSTISGNSASGGSGIGGGIANEIGSLTLMNSTITNNSAELQGGGILNSNGSTATAVNTIISGNISNIGSDFRGQPFNTETNNLIGVNALLAPLGFYGGQTQLHALLSGSTAINSGTATNAPTADQRGAARVGNVDIGAFELSNTANGGTYAAVLAVGNQGVFYNQQITANNGAFTYSVTSGALPNGVNLNTNVAPNAVVALTGTPMQGGTFDFAITASDGTNSNVTNYRLQILAPTAAGVSVSGRVSTNNGRGLRNAIVTMIDSGGNFRSYRTGAFGYFIFDDVEVGETYVFQVQSKQFQFAPQVVTISEELTELNFTAQ